MQMINIIIGLFTYAIVGTVVFKLTRKLYDIDPCSDDGRPHLFGMLWPMCIPLIAAWYIGGYCFKHIINPVSDKIIAYGEEQLDKFCKNKKNRNVD
jgi:hypothetical protein